MEDETLADPAAQPLTEPVAQPPAQLPTQLPKGSFLVLKAVFLVIHIIFGILGFIFFAWHENVRAAWGCVALAMVCALYLYLNCDVMKGNLHESYSFTRHKFCFILSIVVGVIELGWTITYIALGAVFQKGFQFSHDVPTYFDAVPSAYACLWSFLLSYQCKCYMTQLRMAGLAETSGTYVVQT